MNRAREIVPSRTLRSSGRWSASQASAFVRRARRGAVDAAATGLEIRVAVADAGGGGAADSGACTGTDRIRTARSTAQPPLLATLSASPKLRTLPPFCAAK